VGAEPPASCAIARMSSQPSRWSAAVDCCERNSSSHQILLREPKLFWATNDPPLKKLLRLLVPFASVTYTTPAESANIISSSSLANLWNLATDRIVFIFFWKSDWVMARVYSPEQAQ